MSEGTFSHVDANILHILWVHTLNAVVPKMLHCSCHFCCYNKKVISLDK